MPGQPLVLFEMAALKASKLPKQVGNGCGAAEIECCVRGLSLV